ncbi:hypothetical protein HY449_00270 [Candidatus Pacearchaeota archaeon]|nr:hypothetical protein [Candidatus Pacearchaeota archaeon]
MDIPKSAGEYKPGMIINTNGTIDGYCRVISREEYVAITGESVNSSNSYFKDVIFYTQLKNGLTLNRQILRSGQNPQLFKDKNKALSDLEKRIEEARKIRKLILQ